MPDAHHPLSHHQNDPEKLAKLAKINTFHMQLFAYFLERLRTTPDGDGSLLDHSMLLYGSASATATCTSTTTCRSCWSAAPPDGSRAAGTSCIPKDTPVTNLYLNMLDKLGVPVETASATAPAGCESMSEL